MSHHRREYYRLSQSNDLGGLVVQLNNLFGHLVDRLDEMSGDRGTPEINSNLILNGSLRLGYVSVGNNYATVENDCILGVNTSLVAITITVSIITIAAGHLLFIKDVGGNVSTNAITIQTEGKATIDGQDSIDIFENYKSRILFCDGSNWFTLGG